MLVDFNTLPGTSRVWIYQANRTFTEAELLEIEKGLQDFLQEWTAHGNDLKAGFEIRYNRFIIIALDQNRNGSFRLFHRCLGTFHTVSGKKIWHRFIG